MGGLDYTSPTGRVALGVVVGVLSTSCQAIGLTLQRQSHILEDAKESIEEHRPPYRRRRWQIGMLLFLFANIVGSSIQITTLPLPVLSALQASGLVFNTIFASLILSEPFTTHSVLGTILVCIGAVLIAFFGAISEPPHSLQQLLALLRRPQFVIWIAATLIVVAVTWALIHMMKFLSRRSIVGWKKFILIPSSDSEISQRPLEQFCTETSHSHRSKTARGLLYGMISGILSAHTLLLAKSVVELLVRTLLQGSNQFRVLGSWVLLLSMITLALVQLYFLHCGLKLCSTSVLYPFVFCIYNVIAILDGLIYFSESADKLSFLDGAAIALGTMILLLGVAFLSWRPDGEHARSEAIDREGCYSTEQAHVGYSEDPSSLSHLRGQSFPRTVPHGSISIPVYDEHEPLLKKSRPGSSSDTRQYRLSESAGSYGTFGKQPEVETHDIWAELEENGRSRRDPDVGKRCG